MGCFYVGVKTTVRTQYPDNPNILISIIMKKITACALDQDNNVSCWGDDTTG